jgi:hypothetical protein
MGRRPALRLVFALRLGFRGKGVRHVLEELLGCTVDEAFTLLSARGLDTERALSREKGPHRWRGVATLNVRNPL